MKVKDLLTGLEARQPQTVANMTVIPLVSQQGFDDVGTVDDLYLESDPDYGTLVIGTHSGDATVIPQGYSYITKESAQDRTLPSAHVVAGKGNKAMNAFCVQSSQCGHMSKTFQGDRQFRLLPAGLRSAAFGKRGSHEIGSIWPDIGAFNRQLGCSGDFLVTFFSKFAQQLEEFVAEFEPVPNQRGSIVLINGEVVGVDVLPSERAYLAIWQRLIRDCYGSEALFRREVAGQKDVEPFVLEDVDDLDDLLPAVEALSTREKEWAQKIVDKVLDEEPGMKKEETEGNFTVSSLKTSEYDGQVVTRDSDTLYLSMFHRAPRKRGFGWN